MFSLAPVAWDVLLISFTSSRGRKTLVPTLVRLSSIDIARDLLQMSFQGFHHEPFQRQLLLNDDFYDEVMKGFVHNYILPDRITAT